MANPVGGIPEQAAGFGYLLKHGTAEDIAASITHVLDHYEQFQVASIAMSDHARRTYSIDSMVKKHLDLYQRVAGVYPRRHQFWLRGFNPVVRNVAKRWGTAGPPTVTHRSPSQVPVTGKS